MRRRDVSRRAVVTALPMVVLGGRAAAREPLRLGLTPVFLDSDLALLRALEAYLGRATGFAPELVKRRTYQEITALLLAGRLDAAWICGYPFVEHADRLALVAVPLHRGSPLYRSYLIVPADSGAERLEDLRGTTHAFSDPASNSGYLVTRHRLLLDGERPETFFARSFFTFGHRNVIRAVAAGLADGGSVDGYVWEVMARREPAIAGATRVLEASEWFGFPPIAALAAQRRSPAVEALARALVAMPQDPLGREILAVLDLDGFVPGEPILYAGIAAMRERLRAEG